MNDYEEAIVQAAGSALVRHKGKWVSADPGTYRHAVTLGLMMKHADTEISIRDITLAQYRHWTNDLEIYSRGQAWRAINIALGAGFAAYPIYDPLGHHRLVGVKLCKTYTEQDLAGISDYLEQCEARCETFCAKVDLVKAVIRAYRKRKHRTNGNGE